MQHSTYLIPTVLHFSHFSEHNFFDARDIISRLHGGGGDGDDDVVRVVAREAALSLVATDLFLPFESVERIFPVLSHQIQKGLDVYRRIPSSGPLRPVKVKVNVCAVFQSVMIQDIVHCFVPEVITFEEESDIELYAQHICKEFTLDPALWVSAILYEVRFQCQRFLHENLTKRGRWRSPLHHTTSSWSCTDDLIPSSQINDDIVGSLPRLVRLTRQQSFAVAQCRRYRSRNVVHFLSSMQPRKRGKDDDDDERGDE
eukprot:PhM_4_TR12840/c0_g1_i1/m.28729